MELGQEHQQREVFLRRPVLFNAALYSAIALVYSVSFFIVDRVNSGQYVFDEHSNLRAPFGYLAVSSWPVLLFGGLITVAVRVGANVQRRRRRRRRRKNRSRKSSTRSRHRSSQDIPDISNPLPNESNGGAGGSSDVQLQKQQQQQQNRASAPSTNPANHRNDPATSADETERDVTDAKMPVAARRSRSRPQTPSAPARLQQVGAGGRPPSSPSASLTASVPGSSSVSRTASPSPDGKRYFTTDDEDESGRKKKKKKGRSKSSKDTSAHSSRTSVPIGFVSVTPAQKLYAAIGFVWVSLGLGLTAAVATLVFLGQRERIRIEIHSLGLEGDDLSSVQWKLWVVPICTGGIFVAMFGLLALTTLFKVLVTLLTKSHDSDIPPTPPTTMSTLNALGDGNSNGNNASRDGPGGSESGTLFDHDAKFLPGEVSEYDTDVDVEKGMISSGLSRSMYEHEVYGMMSDGVPSSSSGTWRQYTSERKLSYQPDDATIDRMMRQLRDMGFTNPHQNIAALQASCFDLEKASDKLANTQVL